MALEFNPEAADSKPAKIKALTDVCILWHGIVWVLNNVVLVVISIIDEKYRFLEIRGISDQRCVWPWRWARWFLSTLMYFNRINDCLVSSQINQDVAAHQPDQDFPLGQALP